jgi:hypothetical protein
MDAQFSDAVNKHGADYLKAEQALRNGGTTASATLRKNLNHADPVARIIARCLLDWNEGRAPQYQEALDYLDRLTKRLARTPVTKPPPTGVAAELNERFGDRVIDFLAVRLLKERDDWPDWKVGTVLFYLKDQKSSAITALLLRFGAETTDARYRTATVDVVKALNDPQLRAKVAAERVRFQAQQKILPTAIADLETASPVP